MMAPAINLYCGIYVDKTALNAAITAANGKSEASYTPHSWAPFAASRTAAVAVRDNPYATQAQVDAAAADLNTKMGALVARADKTTLQAAIAVAESKNSTVYTQASYALMLTYLEEARAVNRDLNATQLQVDTAALNLNNAIAALVKQTYTATIPWSAIASTAYIVGRSWHADGAVTEGPTKIDLTGPFNYLYAGGGASTPSTPKQGMKSVFSVSFDYPVIIGCTINSNRGSEYPSAGGAPTARIGTGNVVLESAPGNKSYTDTYVTGNVATWSSGVLSGWFSVDYTAQAQALRGQTPQLIMELNDNSDTGLAGGGYKINEMNVAIQYQLND